MRLLHLAAVAALMVVLAGCEPTEEQRARAAAVLPDGCTLINIGSYGDLKSLIVVHCVGAKVTTSNFSWNETVGKSVRTKQGVAVVIGEPA